MGSSLEAMRDRVTVRVPATTANLGPGFDCLAMALDIWNTVTVEVGSPGLAHSIEGYGEDRLRRGRTNLVYRAGGTCSVHPFLYAVRYRGVEAGDGQPARAAKLSISQFAGGSKRLPYPPIPVESGSPLVVQRFPSLGPSAPPII